MKRLVCAVALLLLAAAPVFALQTNLIDDVIRMSKSGVADDTIIDYIQASRAPLTVTADDILAMQNAGVSQQVIKAVIEKGGASQSPNPPAEAQPQATSPEPPPQTATSDTGGCLTFDPPVSLWWPYYGTLVPPQLWDPYWYQPRLDARSGAPAAGRMPGSAVARTQNTPVSRDRMPATGTAHAPAASGQAPSATGHAPSFGGRSESPSRPTPHRIESTSRGSSTRSR